MSLYEKLYKEALERAREKRDEYKRLDGEESFVPSDIEYIFPELKESEDERIRKELIKVFSNREKYLIDQSFGDITVSEAIAWLEKQKPSDEALQYLKENHSPSDVSDFQAAMNIAVAKAFDAGRKAQKHVEWSEEDEKIKKRLIQHLDILRGWTPGDPSPIKVKEYYDAWIIWLEKQCVQKPIISNNALREGIAHFGITQYQIDNWLKKYVDVEKQGEQKETLCDRCKREQPSHSCQDITELGRCALEKQGERKYADKK